MIYEELKNYLTEVSGSALTELFDRAVALFDLYELPEYMDTFDAVLGDHLSGNEQDSMDALTNTLISYLDKLLNEHGVFTNELASISFKLDLINGIYLLQHYEDWRSIAVIAMQTTSSMEIFSELMGLVINHTVDNILPYLDIVEDSLISTIKEELTEAKSEEIISVAEVQTQIEAYRKFKMRNRNDALWADKFFTHTDAIGLPYHTYLCVYLDENGHRLAAGHEDTLPIKQVAEDLFSLMCLSEEGIGRAKDMIRKYADLIYSELKYTTALDSAVSDITMEYSRNA